jgi:hypothetical protein
MEAARNEPRMFDVHQKGRGGNLHFHYMRVLNRFGRRR